MSRPRLELAPSTKSCLDHTALSLIPSFFRPSFSFFQTYPSPSACPSVCILHVNTNKMECVANSQMGSKPTTVKRLRLIWFSPRFRWEARPEPGSWHSMCESGQNRRTPAKTMGTLLIRFIDWGLMWRIRDVTERAVCSMRVGVRLHFFISLWHESARRQACLILFNM